MTCINNNFPLPLTTSLTSVYSKPAGDKVTTVTFFPQVHFVDTVDDSILNSQHKIYQTIKARLVKGETLPIFDEGAFFRGIPRNIEKSMKRYFRFKRPDRERRFLERYKDRPKALSNAEAAVRIIRDFQLKKLPPKTNCKPGELTWTQLEEGVRKQQHSDCISGGRHGYRTKHAIRKAFPKGVPDLVKDLTPPQRNLLGEMGAAAALAALHGDKVTIVPTEGLGPGSAHFDMNNVENMQRKLRFGTPYGAENRLEAARIRRKLTRLDSLMDHLTYFGRERCVVEQISTYVKRHSYSQPILIYGAAHRFTEYHRGGVRFEASPGFSICPWRPEKLNATKTIQRIFRARHTKFQVTSA